jgi:predicted metal-dependent hydrolase
MNAVHQWRLRNPIFISPFGPPAMNCAAAWTPAGTRTMNVRVAGYFLQRMKTKWGSCNHRRGHIRLNTQLATKPKDLLEYVIVHEMVHPIEPTHSDRFLTILGEHYPTWREARAELNELPLTAETWHE